MSKTVKITLDELYPLIKEGIDNSQTVEIKISGNSMSPFLKDQKTVVGLDTFPGVLTKHHIYFYKYKDKYILHRYIKSLLDKHYFRGDALHVYELVDVDDIIAEVSYLKNNGKKINPYTLNKKMSYMLNRMYKVMRHWLGKLVKRYDG